MLRGGTTAAYVGESLFDLLTRTALTRDAHVSCAISRRRRASCSCRRRFPVRPPTSRDARRAGVQDRLGRADQPAAAAAHRAERQADDHFDRHVDAGGDRPRRCRPCAPRADFALMHCTSTYPTPYRARAARLHPRARRPVRRAGRILRPHARQLHGVRGGALGASMFEKHFTDVADAAGPGPAGLDGAGGARGSRAAASARSSRRAARLRRFNPASRTSGHGASQRRVGSRHCRRRHDSPPPTSGRSGRGPASRRGSWRHRRAWPKRAIAKDRLIALGRSGSERCNDGQNTSGD